MEDSDNPYQYFLKTMHDIVHVPKSYYDVFNLNLETFDPTELDFRFLPGSEDDLSFLCQGTEDKVKMFVVPQGDVLGP